MSHDLVIVGGGIAGMCAALQAPGDARIVVIDKGAESAGSSPLAQGGLAAAVGVEDSVELHAKDTIVAGAGICDEELVQDVCAQGPDTVAWLESLGCRFDRDARDAIDLAREGGQSVARSVHVRDATGAEIVRALRDAVRARRIEHVKARAISLVVSDGTCDGVATEEAGVFRASATLLATGGAGALWGRTTNAPGAYGEGIALALDADVQLADLEFMQFHPTALDDGSQQRVLLTEALRGHGAVLVDERGERFVDELAPRHVVAKAILDVGRAFLDCRGIADLERAFPTVMDGARARGFDPASRPLPVSPAAHYFIGGVATDGFGRTSMPGLYAAGECAATGMHGANRLAGNSLLETVVIGRRIGDAVRTFAPTARTQAEVSGLALAPGFDPRIAGFMWSCAGPIRDGRGLQGGLSDLASIADSPYRRLCEMILRAANARAESRGVHIRSDFPQTDSACASRSFDRWERA